MSEPTLSVVLINYNYGRYIEKALTTILEQSYRPLEIIAIDDASSDESVSIIKRLFLGREHCRLIEHIQNKGVLPTLQEALDTAQGTYIYLASSDDFVEPEFFFKSMNLFEKNPDLGLCCGKPSYFTDEKEKKTQCHLGIEDSVHIWNPEQLARAIRKSHFSVAGVTCIYRREFLLKYGGFRESLKSYCDGFLIYQIAFRHPIGYIPEAFAAVRIHASSYSAGVTRLKKSRIEIFAKLIESIRAEPQEVVALFKKSGVLLYFGKQFLAYLFRSPKQWPFLFAAIGKQFKHKKLKFIAYLKRDAYLSRAL